MGQNPQLICSKLSRQGITGITLKGDHDYFFYHDNDDTPDYDTDLLQAAVLLLDQPGAAAFLVKASASRSAVLTLLSSTKNMTVRS